MKTIMSPKRECWCSNGCNNKATVKEVDADTHKVEVTISKSNYPETSQHIEDAIASGKPDIVTIARDKAKQNRAKIIARS